MASLRDFVEPGDRYTNFTTGERTVRPMPDVRRIIFQQEASENFQSPWPVVVDKDQSIVHGRPDAHYLVGFGPKGVQEVTVMAKEVLADPELAVGLAPTFTGYDGNMFSVDLVVKSCDFYEATEAAVATLKEREAKMREALER